MLAEVVSLWAGFTHLDDIESASRNSRSSHHQDGFALELVSLCNTSPTNSAPDSQPDFTDPRNLARKNAWAPIRTVRRWIQILSNIPSLFLTMSILLLSTTSWWNAMTPKDLVKQETTRRSVCDSGGDTWIECLGDLGSYRMAIEDDDIRD
ncbi:hypothetical protein FPRO05_10076 [Fusarium proliferatum]|uniref:Uncharacterized protein n=1 Tax=Gibberella intermedia TaxID=948311 RepID=A0A365NEC9_GIBIN|nr:hypothetical protein FPRO05_10076 [Fusarium proliferatum]